MISNYLMKRLDSIYQINTRIAEAELARQYQRLAKKTKKQVEDLFAYIQKEKHGEGVLLSDLFRYQRYYDLLASLNEELRQLGMREVAITEKCMMDAYTQAGREVKSFYSFSQKLPTREMVKKAVNQVWNADGKAFSLRIWQNKTKIATVAEEALVDAIARGDSLDKIASEVMRRFDSVGFHEAVRLVRTETVWAQNRGAIDRYKDAGVASYEVGDAGDDRECDECREKAGKRYPIDDLEHLPPYHPNCRCFTFAVLDEEENK